MIKLSYYLKLKDLTQGTQFSFTWKTGIAYAKQVSFIKKHLLIEKDLDRLKIRIMMV
jgi:hypothetical protein